MVNWSTYDNFGQSLVHTFFEKKEIIVVSPKTAWHFRSCSIYEERGNPEMDVWKLVDIFPSQVPDELPCSIGATKAKNHVMHHSC